MIFGFKKNNCRVSYRAKKLTAIFAVGFFVLNFNLAEAASLRDVVINEIAWAGTAASSSDEWIELYNNTASVIDLSGWVLKSADGSPDIVLSSTVSSRGYFLIERTDDSAVSLPADWFGSFGSGGLLNSGEKLQLFDNSGNLIDEADFSSGWPAGAASPNYQTMERISPLSDGNSATNWAANDGQTKNGSDAEGGSLNGTPKSQNSVYFVSSGDSSQNEPKTVSVPRQNKAPFAATNADEIFANVGEEIIFDGSLSFDTDGDTLSFNWNFGDGTESKKSENLKIISHSYAYPGTYIAVLAVSDYLNESKVQIVVNVYPGNVLINEFLPNPEGSDENKEWIELYNQNKYPIDLSGWSLNNFVFPRNTIIFQGGYLVVSSEISKITLKNNPKESGEKVVLAYPNGEAEDGVSYTDDTKDGYSAARRGDDFLWTKNITPGIQNIFTDEAENKKQSSAEAKFFVQRGEISIKKYLSVRDYFLRGDYKADKISFLAKPVFAAVSGFDGELGYAKIKQIATAFSEADISQKAKNISEKEYKNISTGTLFGSENFSFFVLFIILSFCGIIFIVVKLKKN